MPLFGQQRIFLDLNPPSLVISKMPVKPVQLIERHGIQQILNLLNGEEMPCHIQHDAPPSEFRSILHAAARDSHGSVPGRKRCDVHQLPQCGYPVTHSGRAVAGYGDSFARYVKSIRSVRYGVRDLEHDVSAIS